MAEQASFLSGVTSATAVDKINSAIIFGEFGTGKTVLAASASAIEDYNKVLIVDIEGSAAGVGRLYPNVDVIQADTFDKLEFIKKELLTKEHPYKTVIFDTLNVAQGRAEQKFKADPKNLNNKFGAWEDLGLWTMDFIRSMHHAPFLAFFIAHSDDKKDDVTGRTTTTVKIKGGSVKEVPTVVDLVGYLDVIAHPETGDPTRVLRVGKSNGIITKNRFGLPDLIGPGEDPEGPTMIDVQAAILKAQSN